MFKVLSEKYVWFDGSQWVSSYKDDVIPAHNNDAFYAVHGYLEEAPKPKLSADDAIVVKEG